MRSPDWIAILLIAFFVAWVLFLVIGAWQTLRWWYWNYLLSHLVQRRVRRGDNAGALRLLERATRRYHPDTAAPDILHAHYWYGHLLYQEGRYAEAVQRLRSIAARGLKPAYRQAQVRWEIASALAAQGKMASAREERQIALTTLERSRSWRSRALEGRILLKEKRYEAACASFEAALSALPEKQLVQMSDYLRDYAAALLGAHRYADCVQAASEAVRLGESGARIVHTCWIAGQASKCSGDRSSAAAWFARTAAEAEGRKLTLYLVSARISEAYIAALEGNTAMAERLLLDAERHAASRSERINAAAGRAHLLLALDRFDDAEEALTQVESLMTAAAPADEVDEIPAPDAALFCRQRLWLALIRLELHIERGAAEQAASDFALIQTESGAARHRDADDQDADDMMPSPLEWAALHAWIDVHRAPSGEAIREIERLLGALEAEARQHPEQRPKQQWAYYLLTTAALRSGAFPLCVRAAEAWHGGCHGAPLFEPSYHYFLGSCHAGEGRMDAARREWRAALSYGVETKYVRLARERLKTAA